MKTSTKILILWLIVFLLGAMSKAQSQIILGTTESGIHTVDTTRIYLDTVIDYTFINCKIKKYG